MKHTIIIDIEKINMMDFIPTIIVGFYQKGKEKVFLQKYEQFKSHFPHADIIGCSSESNIYDTVPHLDMDGDHFCIFMCMDMQKESYSLQISNEEKDITYDKKKKYGAIVLAAEYNEYIENLVLKFQNIVEEQSLFGAIAGIDTLNTSKGTIFYNGEYLSSGVIVWLIDQEDYLLNGMSVHDFDPIGFELEVTKAEGYKLLEIENNPALDVVEDMIGTIDTHSIASFDHPFFITSERNLSYENIPLCAVHSIDRINKSIEVYKKVSAGNYLKIAIPVNRKEQEKQLAKFHKYANTNGIAFLFLCVAYRGHWGDMEHIYLMHFAKNIKIPFIGFHTLGEIGPLSRTSCSRIQNQTITLAVLSKRR